MLFGDYLNIILITVFFFVFFLFFRRDNHIAAFPSNFLLVFLSYAEGDFEIVLGEHHLVYQTGNEIRRKAKFIIKVKGSLL
jgi:hypothetical protein